jgi:hypothetical protein
VFTKWLCPHRQKFDYLAAAQLKLLREAVLTSPYLGVSDLNEGFATTQGFSLLFKREKREQVKEMFPEFEPYLEKALKPEANVFFLNPLVIRGGSAVGKHADKTLGSYVKGSPFPRWVSVLYLGIPSPKQGGDIVFHRGPVRHRISPKENSMVEFPGWLLHEVTPLRTESEEPRVSLVVEQYNVSDEILVQAPVWHLDTCRPFEEFLLEAQGGG